MIGRAYPLSYGHEISQKVTGVVRSVTKKIRARFSRDAHHIDHWGGSNPEPHFVILLDPDDDLEYWPKKGGTSFEEFDIKIG